MARLDRLGWAAGWSFECHGVVVGIRTNDPAAGDLVRAALPPGSRPSRRRRVDHLVSLWFGRSETPRRKAYHLLYLGTQGHARTRSRDEILETLENVLLLTVASHSSERLFVHAGVVAWENEAILLPGSSGCGKTTLVRAMVAAGATYYSDEMALVDRSGCVHPFARRPRIRTRPGQARIAVDIEPACVGSRPLPVGAVLFTRFDPSAIWRPRTVPPGRALVHLLDQTVAPRREPQLALEVLSAIVGRARCFRGKRGESAQIVEFLNRTLAPLERKQGWRIAS